MVAGVPLAQRAEKSRICARLSSVSGELGNFLLAAGRVCRVGGPPPGPGGALHRTGLAGAAGEVAGGSFTGEPERGNGLGKRAGSASNSTTLRARMARRPMSWSRSAAAGCTTWPPGTEGIPADRGLIQPLYWLQATGTGLCNPWAMILAANGPPALRPACAARLGSQLQIGFGQHRLDSAA